MRFVDDVSGAGVGLSRVVDVIFSFQTLVRQLEGDFVVMTSCSWSVYILTTVLNVLPSRFWNIITPLLAENHTEQ